MMSSNLVGGLTVARPNYLQLVQLEASHRMSFAHSSGAPHGLYLASNYRLERLQMFKRYLIAFAWIAALATPATAQVPVPWTKVGMLRCLLDPSVGFIVTGHESMQCSFAQSGGSPQAYEGAINMVGLDVISTAAGGVFEWAVFASTTDTPAGALSGEYVGASGDLGIIAGVSTGILIGGSGRTFALQPISLGGSVAVKDALGISVLKLRPKLP
jgi:hypothetical protein